MSGIQVNNVFHGCGRLGNEPAVQIMPSGKKIYSFSIAIDRTWVDINGKKQKKTNWIRCVAFHPLSKYIEACHIHKGSKVSVVGSVENEDYTDKNGVQRQSYSIWLSGFEKQSSDKEDGTASANASANNQATNPPASYEPENPDDLPF